MPGNKYGDIDELLSGADNKPKSSSSLERKRRPSPALGVMTGDKRPTAVTDALKADKDKAEKALEDAKRQFQEEKQSLLEQIDNAKAGAGHLEGRPIVLTMPITKQEVRFELKRVDPALIDVSPENERIQLFLDEISLQDILPSIKQHGQQKPGTLRPLKGGRFELIEGSRRLAAVKLAKQNYLAFVGDVPNADVRELGIIENRHQDVSPYEKAKAYQRQLESGEFDTWTQLGAAKGISSSHIARYKACVELDEIFVRILPSPSDMPLSYGETIIQLKKKDGDQLKLKAEELLKWRHSALNKKSDLLDVEDILKSLKSAVRTKIEAPKIWKPVFYQSKDGKKKLKHSVTNQGTTKFEISGVDENQITKVLSLLKDTLKLEK